MTELSRRLNRQIGLLINRKGVIRSVIVGDTAGLFLPDLSDEPLGRRVLRGLRLVHTHLNDESLTRDDLTDLALLRFDILAAVGVSPNGLPLRMHTAHVLPPNPEGRTTEVNPAVPFHQFDVEFMSFVSALEEELTRAQPRTGRADVGRERAILVSVSTQPRSLQEESMEELAELARSSDVEVLDRILQRPKKVNPRTLLGQGKLNDLVIGAMQLGATILIFDQSLTPTQVATIAGMTDLKVIDRSQLILDIFAGRAHSRDGKVQVELAQLKYRLSRLTGKGTAMSRLMGGIGGRGPGETKLEIDRRRARDRIALLERQLKTLSSARRQRKSRREKAGLPIISIVGYTNAGKSTLLNTLTRSATTVENKMFATLDTASRRLRFPREREVIVTDTVGFIRDLPRDLMAAFRATLEELADADLLLHLVDAGHPNFEAHIASVEGILDELGLSDIPRIVVFNKSDTVEPDTMEDICLRYGALAISALDPGTLSPLLAVLEQRIWNT